MNCQSRKYKTAILPLCIFISIIIILSGCKSNTTLVKQYTVPEKITENNIPEKLYVETKNSPQKHYQTIAVKNTLDKVKEAEAVSIPEEQNIPEKQHKAEVPAKIEIPPKTTVQKQVAPVFTETIPVPVTDIPDKSIKQKEQDKVVATPGKFMIITGSFQSRVNAESVLKELIVKGYSKAYIKANAGMFRVIANTFSDREAAVNFLNTYKKENPKFRDAWMFVSN